LVGPGAPARASGSIIPGMKAGTVDPARVAIRDATKADREAIRALVFGVLAEYGLKPDPTGTDADLDDVEASYAARGGLFELLESGGALLGTVGLYPLGNGKVELRKMYLVKEARGLGLGKKLLTRTIENARRLGFSVLVLETASVLVEAIALYSRMGFTAVSSDHLANRCDRAFSMTL
jgi:putative acetyltransferase